MSFLQKQQGASYGVALCYKAACMAAFLFFGSCCDSVPDPFSFSLSAGPSDEPGISQSEAARQYVWPGLNYNVEHTIARRISPPPGARRTKLHDGSFAAWLRNLPVLPGRPPVYLYDGRRKVNQTAHHVIIDMDTGRRDLQQCADALMRLRSEYLFANSETARIQFQFTDQIPARYELWARGFRPQVRQRRKTRWVQRAKRDTSYAGFRSYLENLFTYAGTYSLSRESRAISLEEMRAGDFLIQGGFPGHAVMVVDMAESIEDGRRYYLLAQSYMPAQQMHVLRNPAGDSAWYVLEPSREGSRVIKPAQIKIATPEWDFTGADLKRFRD